MFGARGMRGRVMSRLSPNADQERAVSALRGPVLISAGAGSGKTRTLTERFVRALSDRPGEGWEAADVDDVLTITFTEKAAGELSQRVRGALRAEGRPARARELDAAWIATIHGFCARMLRRYALEAGLDPDFHVLDAVAAGRFEEEAFERAAESVLGTADGARLFAGYEFDQIFAACTRLARELRTRGLGADALHVPPARSVREVFEDALELFTGAGDRVAACGDTRSSATTLVARCRATYTALSGIGASELDEADLGTAVWSALAMWSAGRSTKEIREVREELAAAHTRLIEDAAACATTPYARALHSLVAAHGATFRTLKTARGGLDFDDLQLRLLRLFDERPDVLAQVRAEFRLVMVDEFQDTDGLQARLVSAVAGENLCTVGDECQAIYGFRGADVAVYRAHNDRMWRRGARRFELALNYRSHPDILTFVDALFDSEGMLRGTVMPLRHGRVEPETPVVPEGTPRVELLVVGSGDSSEAAARAAEADALAERLAALRDSAGVPAAHMAVLLRTYRHAATYAAALSARGFEALVAGRSRFFECAEVEMVRALVRTVANPGDEGALIALLASDAGRMSDDGLLVLSGATDETGSVGLWRALICARHRLDALDASRAEVVRGVVERARETAGRQSATAVLRRAIAELGVDEVLLARGAHGAQAYANVLEVVRLCRAYEAGGGAGFPGLVSHLQDRERFDRSGAAGTMAAEGAGAVRIMSIHAAKGLEFPVVAVASLGSTEVSDRGFVRVRASDDGKGVEFAARLPVQSSDGRNRSRTYRELDERNRADTVEEAKRLLYVACTRAREVLVLSGTAKLKKDPHESADAPLVWVRRAFAAELGELSAGQCRVVDIAGAPVRCDVRCPAEAAEARDNEESVPRYEPPIAHVAAPDDAAPWVPRRLSFSDLALFDRCELRFFAERVLRTGTLDCASPDDARAFGSAVHAALQVLGESGTLAPERVRALVRAHGLPDADRVRVAQAVDVFAGSRVGAELAAMPLVRQEWRFAVALPDGAAEFELVGSLDAYGRDGDRGLVVDYKVSDASGGDDGRARYGLQARCYALAALRDGCETLRIEFLVSKGAGPAAEPEAVTFEYRSEERASLEAEIVQRRGRIASSDFQPLAQWCERTCAECPVAGGLCPVPVPQRGPGSA